MPSYLAMKKAALADAKVAEELNKTAAAKASDVFQKAEETPGVKPAEGEANVDWLQEAKENAPAITVIRIYLVFIMRYAL